MVNRTAYKMFADDISGLNAHVDINLMMSVSRANLVSETELALKETAQLKVLRSGGWPQGLDPALSRALRCLLSAWEAL